MGTHVRAGEPVPNGGHRGERYAIVQAVGLRGVQEKPIGKRRSENRSEVMITGGVVSGQSPVKGNVGFPVEANGVNVVASGAQESVHSPVVIFHAPAGIGVVWTRMGTTSEITRKGMSEMHLAALVAEGQPRLLAIDVRQPTQKMIEAAVLHRHDDDVLDATACRGRQA